MDIDQLVPFPKNPTIASVFREMGWIEELGAGVVTFRTFCPMFYAGNLPEIEDGDVFRCTLILSDEGGQKGGQTNTPDMVLQLLKSNPKITRKEIAESIWIAPSAIQKHINALKENKLIKRIGGDRSGYWAVMDKAK